MNAVTAGADGRFYTWVAEKPINPDADSNVNSLIARRRQVTLGLFSGSSIQVLDGLKEGDEIIVQGAAQLRDGDALVLLDEIEETDL